jgi:hypothetical protein
VKASLEVEESSECYLNVPKPTIWVGPDKVTEHGLKLESAPKTLNG